MTRQGSYAAWAVLTLVAAGPRAAEAQSPGPTPATLRDAGGAVLTGARLTVRGPSPRTQSGGVSIFGERGPALSFLVDGAENNDPLNGAPSVRYTQDSVREFEVITTGYEAEFGRAQGGVANIVTRSGGNEWAGSAFTFVR